MKESAAGKKIDPPVKLSLSDSEGRQLSKVQQDCFKDSTVIRKPVI